MLEAGFRPCFAGLGGDAVRTGDDCFLPGARFRVLFPFISSIHQSEVELSVAHSICTGCSHPMSGTKNLSQLGQLVAFHHGWQAAKAFKTCQMDDADRAKLSFSALEILRVFSHLENSSALMSAASLPISSARLTRQSRLWREY